MADIGRKRDACPERRLLVEPWAAEATPAEIFANKQSVIQRAFPVIKQKEMHFQGSIWRCNLENFLHFTRGCDRFGISVIRHGDKIVPLTIWPMNVTDALLAKMNFRMEQSSKSLIRILAERHVQYAPAFQGGCHSQHGDPSRSYIADRILNVIAAGFFPLINNVAAFELLDHSSAIVYHEKASCLQRDFGHRYWL
jgi:hypothetical protein